MATAVEVLSPTTPTSEPTPAEMKHNAETWLQRAQQITVTDQTSLNTAGNFLLQVKTLRAEAETRIRPTITAAHKAWQTALDLLKGVDGPLKQAEDNVTPKILAYHNEQKRIAEEKRKAEERRIAEEEERRRAEQMEQEIETAEAQGATVEEVKAIIEQPRPIVVDYATATRLAATSAPAVPAGFSTRETWSASVTNVRALCAAIGGGTQPIEYVIGLDKDKATGRISSPALNKVATALKSALNIPGVQPVKTDGLARGRR